MAQSWVHKFEIKEGTWVFVPDEQARVKGGLIKKEIEKKWNPPSYYAHLNVGGHVLALINHKKTVCLSEQI